MSLNVGQDPHNTQPQSNAEALLYPQLRGQHPLPLSHLCSALGHVGQRLQRKRSWVFLNTDTVNFVAGSNALKAGETGQVEWLAYRKD